MLTVALQYQIINAWTDLEFAPSTFLTGLRNTVAGSSHSICASFCSIVQVCSPANQRRHSVAMLKASSHRLKMVHLIVSTLFIYRHKGEVTPGPQPPNPNKPYCTYLSCFVDRFLTHNCKNNKPCKFNSTVYLLYKYGGCVST